MSQGKIKKLVSERGFGFIEGSQGDLFFHTSEVQGVSFDALREGQDVEYTAGQNKGRPCATSVRVTALAS